MLHLSNDRADIPVGALIVLIIVAIILLGLGLLVRGSFNQWNTEEQEKLPADSSWRTDKPHEAISPSTFTLPAQALIATTYQDLSGDT